MDRRVVEYIAKAKKKNFSEEKIVEILKFYRWSEEEIEEGIKEALIIIEEREKKKERTKKLLKIPILVLQSPYYLVLYIFFGLRWFFKHVISSTVPVLEIIFGKSYSALKLFLFFIFVSVPKIILQIILGIFFLIVLLVVNLAEFSYVVLKTIVIIPYAFVRGTRSRINFIVSSARENIRIIKQKREMKNVVKTAEEFSFHGMMNPFDQKSISPDLIADLGSPKGQEGEHIRRMKAGKKELGDDFDPTKVHEAYIDRFFMIRLWILVTYDVLRIFFRNVYNKVIGFPLKVYLFFKEFRLNVSRGISSIAKTYGNFKKEIRDAFISLVKKMQATFLIIELLYVNIISGRHIDRDKLLAEKQAKIKSVVGEPKVQSTFDTIINLITRFFATKERMRFTDVLRLSLRMFKTRTMRTFLTILGISIGIGTILFLVSFGYGIQNIVYQEIASDEALLSLDVSSGGELLPLDNENISKIKDIDGVDIVSALANIQAQVSLGGINSSTTINIADIAYFKLGAIIPKFGNLYNVENKKEIVVSSGIAPLLGIGNEEDILGRDLEIKLLKSKITGTGIEEFDTIVQTGTFKVVGIIGSEGENFIYAQKEAIENYDVGRYSQAKVKVKEESNMLPVRTAIEDKGFLVSAISDTIEQAKKIFQGVQIILSLFGIIALFVSAIGMFNTMTIALLERTQEIGIMKSLGASNGDIWSLFIVESLVMGFLGGVVGISIGLVGGVLFNYILNLLAQSFGGQALDLFLSPPWFLVTILTFSSLVGLFTGLWPARRASNLDTLKALRYK